jgi:hypothetical protein
MDKVQKPSNSECLTPSSEPFRIYQNNKLSARLENGRIYNYYVTNVHKIFKENALAFSLITQNCQSGTAAMLSMLSPLVSVCM